MYLPLENFLGSLDLSSPRVCLMHLYINPLPLLVGLCSNRAQLPGPLCYWTLTTPANQQIRRWAQGIPLTQLAPEVGCARTVLTRCNMAKSIGKERKSGEADWCLMPGCWGVPQRTEQQLFCVCVVNCAFSVEFWDDLLSQNPGDEAHLAALDHFSQQGWGEVYNSDDIFLFYSLLQLRKWRAPKLQRWISE